MVDSGELGEYGKMAVFMRYFWTLYLYTLESLTSQHMSTNVVL